MVHLLCLIRWSALITFIRVVLLAQREQKTGCIRLKNKGRPAMERMNEDAWLGIAYNNDFLEAKQSKTKQHHHQQQQQKKHFPRQV